MTGTGVWGPARCAHCGHPRSDHHRYEGPRNACYSCSCATFIARPGDAR